MNRFHTIAFACALILAHPAIGDTITFETAALGLFAGSQAEGDFTYSLAQGGLFVDCCSGNPDQEMEGAILNNGGAFSVVRNDVLDGVFLFDAASVAQFGYVTGSSVTFEGYLAGAFQAADTFSTSALDLVHTTHSSSNLNNVAIDELRVVLPASLLDTAFSTVDNIVLAFIPEATAPAQIVLALVLIGAHRRYRRR